MKLHRLNPVVALLLGFVFCINASMVDRQQGRLTESDKRWNISQAKRQLFYTTLFSLVDLFIDYGAYLQMTPADQRQGAINQCIINHDLQCVNKMNLENAITQSIPPTLPGKVLLKVALAGLLLRFGIPKGTAQDRNFLQNWEGTIGFAKLYTYLFILQLCVANAAVSESDVLVSTGVYYLSELNMMGIIPLTICFSFLSFVWTYFNNR